MHAYNSPIREIARAVARIETTRHSQVRFVIHKHSNNPYALKRRLLFFAHKAGKVLEIESENSSSVVLRVHHR